MNYAANFEYKGQSYYVEETEEGVLTALVYKPDVKHLGEPIGKCRLGKDGSFRKMMLF